MPAFANQVIVNQKKAEKKRRVVRKKPAPSMASIPRALSPDSPALRGRPTIGQIPNLGAPGEKQVAATKRRQARTAPRSLPHVPIVPNPTREQTRAATKLIRDAVNRQVGSHGSGADKVRRKRELFAELERDPRARDFIAASRFYSTVERTRQDRRIGRNLGAVGKAEQEKLGREVVKYQRQRDTVREAPEDPKLSVMGLNVNLADVGRELRKPFERGDLGPREFAQNAARDLKDLPANAVLSVALPAKELVEGRPLEAAKMIVDPYVQLAKDPERMLREHPLNTALMVGGAVRGADLAAGKAVRTVTGTRGSRPPAVVPGTNLRQPRPAAKGLVGRTVQKRRDRHAPSPRMSEAEIRRRVDESFAASEDVRRIERSEAVKAAEQAVGKKPTAAVSLAAQNIARGKDELAGYLLELQRAEGSLTGAKRRANRDAQRQIRSALKRDDAGTGAAARRYAALSQEMQAKLVQAGLLDAKQEERARLAPYAHRHMGADHDLKIGLYVNRDGTKVPLSNEAIREHMATRGVPEPAFVTHAPNTRGARNFYVPTDKAPTAPTGTRTGAAVREGTFDLHPDTLVEGVARAQGLVTAVERYGQQLGEFGLRSRTGKLRQFMSRRQAVRAAADVSAEHGINFVPVRATPFGARKIELDAILERANDPSHPAFQQVLDAFDEALAAGGPDGGPWVLIPQAAAEQMRHHIARTGGRGPLQSAGNLYGTQWRRTVLALSPKWLTGNVVEAAVRSTVAHVGPRSVITGRRVVKRLEQVDPKAARELRVRATGGGHYSLNRRAGVYTAADHFAASKLKPVAVALAKVRRTPGPKQLVDLWNAYTDMVMNQLNGRIESGFQSAMLGKALRDSPLMDGHTRKLSAKAIEQAVQGLRHTEEQVALGRAVDRMYGKYSKFNPEVRRMIAAYTPFAAWWMNSVRFVFDVLPRDHPVLTALLASANVATQEWREEHGLAVGAEGAVPGWLMGSIPGGDGSHLRVSRYTPLGLFGDPLGSTADLLLPQFSNVLAAFEGRDWQGNKLRHDDGSAFSDEERLGTALIALFEGATPGASQVHRFLNREGSVEDRLRAEFDPFQFTPGRQPAKPRKVVRKRRPAAGPVLDAPSLDLPPVPDLPSGPPSF